MRTLWSRLGQVGAHIAGEITTSARVDFPKIIRGVVADIGYKHSHQGFDADRSGRCARLASTSSLADIALPGVDNWSLKVAGQRLSGDEFESR